MARKKTTVKETEAGAQVEVTTDVVLTEGAEIDAIEAALNGGTDIEVDLDALSDEIGAEDAKNEAYAAQHSKADIVDAEDTIVVESDTVEPKAKRVAKPRAPKLDFVPGVLAMFADDPCILDTEVGELNDTQLTAVLNSVTQKKVREKVTNAFAHVARGAKLTNYTEIAIKIMASAAELGVNVTSKQLVAAYKAKGYKQGTADAQAGQMMPLFEALGIATRPERGVLKPNENSVMLDAMAA